MHNVFFAYFYPISSVKNRILILINRILYDIMNERSIDLKRDQILFVEKDKNEATHLYSLAEFKGVRNDASFEKDYLDGRYGAVPLLNNFSTIFEN